MVTHDPDTPKRDSSEDIVANSIRSSVCSLPDDATYRVFLHVDDQETHGDGDVECFTSEECSFHPKQLADMTWLLAKKIVTTGVKRLTLVNERTRESITMDAVPTSTTPLAPAPAPTPARRGTCAWLACLCRRRPRGRNSLPAGQRNGPDPVG